MVPLPPSSTHAFFNSFTFASWTSWDKARFGRHPRRRFWRSRAASGEPRCGPATLERGRPLGPTAQTSRGSGTLDERRRRED